MIEYAQWTAVLVACINLFLSLVDKRLFKLFQNKTATDRDSGINVEELGPLFRWRLRRMRYSGFTFDSETNTYFFNERIHRAKRKTRRLRAIVLVVFAILLVLGILFVTQ